MKRLFIGTKISPDIFDFVYDDIKQDFTGITKGKWVEKENIHFTYKFLGDCDEKLIPKIKASLEEILGEHTSSIIIQGISVMPFNRPRVLFAKFFNPDKLILKLYKKIDARMQALDFEEENRPFKPHITLQRIKWADKAELKSVLDQYQSINFGDMNSFQINLIESQLTPQGPIYKTI